MADHISFYDNGSLPKNYLKCSDTLWKICFENKVQYFNRLQKSEWLAFINNAGFELIETESEYVQIDGIRINKKYKTMAKDDLECILLKMLLKKQKR
jgi:hypothetical protein